MQDVIICYKYPHIMKAKTYSQLFSTNKIKIYSFIILGALTTLIGNSDAFACGKGRFDHDINVLDQVLHYQVDEIPGLNPGSSSGVWMILTEGLVTRVNRNKMGEILDVTISVIKARRSDSRTAENIDVTTKTIHHKSHDFRDSFSKRISHFTDQGRNLTFMDRQSVKINGVHPARILSLYPVNDNRAIAKIQTDSTDIDSSIRFIGVELLTPQTE